VSRGEKGPVPVAEAGLVLVTMQLVMSAADLGDFRVIPDVIPDGIPALPGDTVEVDPDTAERWIAAGIAVARAAPPPP